MEKKNCQMHGQVSQDSFYWTKGLLTVFHGRCGDWRGNKRPQDPTMYGQICGSTCLMLQNAKRSKSGSSRNQSSIMPDSYVVSSSLNWMMNNLNTPWKTLVESWKFRCQRQCLVKHLQIDAAKPDASTGISRTKYVCIVDADETMRIRLERVPHRYHEDHIAAKEMNSLGHCNSVHKFIPMLQAMKILDAKAAVEKELGKNQRRHWHGNWRKSEIKMKWLPK